MAATVTRPEVLVIAYGGNVLAERQRNGEEGLRRGQNLKESAKGALADALSVLRHCHWMVKVVVGVIPRFRLTDEALSSMLADMAFSHGAAFIDVVALLSAGDASASGTGVGTDGS